MKKLALALFLMLIGACASTPQTQPEIRPQAPLPAPAAAVQPSAPPINYPHAFDSDKFVMADYCQAITAPAHLVYPLVYEGRVYADMSQILHGAAQTVLMNLVAGTTASAMSSIDTSKYELPPEAWEEIREKGNEFEIWANAEVRFLTTKAEVVKEELDALNVDQRQTTPTERAALKERCLQVEPNIDRQMENFEKVNKPKVEAMVDLFKKHGLDRAIEYFTEPPKEPFLMPDPVAPLEQPPIPRNL